MIVDVHSHLDDKAFDHDLPQVLERAKKAGVVHIVLNGLNPPNNRKIMELNAKHPLLSVACGIYPIDAVSLGEEDVEAEISWIRQNAKKIIGIGEVGLDYKWTEDRVTQKHVFVRMIKLAKELEKPIIVHSRNAEADVIAILEENGATKVVMHCFSGKRALAARITKNGWYLSIPPNVVRSDHFQTIVKDTSINNLLTETDAPYLGPTKDGRNEPANIVLTIQKIAQIKGFEPKEVEQSLYMNYQRLFL